MYHQADTQPLVSLFTSSVHALGATHYGPEQRDAWASIPANLDEWRQRFTGLNTVIAEENGSYMGFISYEASGYIDLLYTAPDYARRGVAAALLLEAIKQLLRIDGVIELSTHASLVAAPFFTRHGFHITKEETVVRRGVSFQRLVMRRCLDLTSGSAVISAEGGA